MEEDLAQNKLDGKEFYTSFKLPFMTVEIT